MYKRYERYKDSGIEWIGEISEHWSISKIKYQAIINNKVLNEKTPEDYEINYIDIGNVDSDGKIIKVEPMFFRDAPSRARRIVSNGDTLVSTVRTYLKAITWLNKAENNLICSTGFAVLSPKNSIEPKYLSYLMRSQLYVEEIVSRSVGVSYPSTTSTAIGNLECIMPQMNTEDINEQKTIANFLEHKTSEIDSLIADKERLIEKLQEYKQSIITEAVTKGLNPDVKMKDSGIEWIGEIPEHWETLKLRYLGKAIIGLTYSPTDVVSEGEGSLVLRASNIKDGKVIIGQNDVYVNTSMPEKLLVIDGDVLICSRSGSKNLVGKCGMIDNESSGHTFGVFMTVFRSEKNKYLFYIFQSQLFRSQIGSFLTTTINQLTINFLNNLAVPLPPNDERIEINEYLKDKTSVIEDLLEDIKSHIKKLKSYRQSLIYEAVTGKIDVRNYEPQRSEKLA